MQISLPYSVINELIYIATSEVNRAEIVASLRKALEAYLGRVTAFESAHRLGL